MDIRERLESALGGYRLLEHPFYKSWRQGTLPVRALRAYAAEYGAFIAAIDAGWETVGETDHAAEERRHAGLWERFARHLGTAVTEPRIPEVATLVDTARRLFAEPATAWGALHSFESQQPATSEEKLLGLGEHYGIDVDSAAAEYFRVHAADYHEADAVVESLAAYPELLPAAVGACAEMSEALWEALSGVLDTVSDR